MTSLIVPTLWGERDMVKLAIDRLREFEPSEGYYLAFSGGKDSQIIYDLAVRAGVKFDAHYSVTTVDPPELVQFIRREYPAVAFDHPEKTMWELIVENGMPPTRTMRYCCRVLKEHGGEGRLVVTGVRWAESARRAQRKMVEPCYKKGKHYLHPIIDWTDEMVWEYHRQFIPRHCELYDEGWHRLGCVLCPMNRNNERDMARWPRIANNYRKACRKAWAAANARGKAQRWANGDEMFEWWIGNQAGTKPGQLELDLGDECEWGSETGEVA